MILSYTRLKRHKLELTEEQLGEKEVEAGTTEREVKQPKVKRNEVPR